MTSLNTSTNLHEASKQWANRPDDQRYLTLESLRDAVETRKRESWTATPDVASLRVIPDEAADNGLGVELFDPTIGARRMINPTNWGFGQLSQYASAPAAYLRKLPAQLAAINLQWGLEHNPQREQGLILARSNGTHELRALTSTLYGRIWDKDVVAAVMNVNGDGRWKIPAASYASRNAKAATTLYASDRDVFIFLVDESRPIEVGGEQLYRGFYTWNSEVGSATFGLTTFLYRYVCDNRIIWGATDVKELKIRHTGGAPERFAYEGDKYLRRYAEESALGIESGIKRAQAWELPTVQGEKRDDTVMSWLQARGFNKTISRGAVESANVEEGGTRSLWDIVQGVTAYARTIPYAADRVEVETRAGKLIDQFAAA